ncbi:MAG: glutamate 5-kinase [Candidatus Omnitrophota bacterium]
MKRIVLKIGSAVLTDGSGRLDDDAVRGITREVSRLLKSGVEVILVSSGAIAAGMSLLNIKKRPADLAELQSIAAIGQTRLMDTYNKYFRKYGRLTGQILITQDDFDDRRRFLNIRYTIGTLLKRGVVPVVNENDTISTEEIKCGDNDRISYLVADSIGADTLILLTNVDGLLGADGRVVREIADLSADVHELASGRACGKAAVSGAGTGGMRTKLMAAECAVRAGIDCYIANGKREGVINEVIKGSGCFTFFKAKTTNATARKRWIGFGSKAKGEVRVDDGARSAVIDKHKSLLSAGIVCVAGEFRAGDIIDVCAKDGSGFARGITNYSSDEIKRIKGVKTGQIETILGYKDHDEVIHRDNLFIRE